MVHMERAAKASLRGEGSAVTWLGRVLPAVPARPQVLPAAPARLPP